MDPRLPRDAEGRGPHRPRRRRPRRLHCRLPHRRCRLAHRAQLRLSLRRSRRRARRHLLRPARPVARRHGPALAGDRARHRDDRGRCLADEAAVGLPALVRGAGRRTAGDPCRLAVGRPGDPGRGPHADRPRRRQDRHRVAGLGAAGHRHRDAVHAVRRPEDDGSRRADPDLCDAGLGPQHRGRPGGPARSRLRRLLRRRRLCLCAAEHAIRAGFLGRAAAGRRLRCDLRHPAGLSGAAPARRLPRHRHPGLRRDHPPGPAQLGRSHQWSGRHRHDPGSDPVRRGVRRDRTCGRQRPCRRCWAFPSTASTA